MNAAQHSRERLFRASVTVDKRAEANPNATKIRPHLRLRRSTGGLEPSCFLLAAVDESDLRINFFDNSLEIEDGVTESESSGTVSPPRLV
jgi:hypothetical protein